MSRESLESFRYCFHLGCDKSGSNLLRLIMGARADCIGEGPFHFFQRVLDAVPPMGNLQQPDVLFGLIKDFMTGRLTWSSSIDKVRPVSDKELLSVIHEGGLGGFYKWFYERMAKEKGASWIFIKEHRVRANLDFVLAHIPEARFIYLVRDPRDVVTSYAKKDSAEGLTFADALKYWQQHQQEIFKIFQWIPADRVFVLRYEDLVTDPEPVLRKMCDHLQMAFDDSMLRHSETKSAKRDAKIRTNRQKKAHPGEQENAYLIDSNLDRPIDSTIMRRYRDRLTPFQIARIESTVGDYMDALGYPRDIIRHTFSTRARLDFQVS